MYHTQTSSHVLLISTVLAAVAARQAAATLCSQAVGCWGEPGLCLVSQLLDSQLSARVSKQHSASWI